MGRLEAVEMTTFKILLVILLCYVIVMSVEGRGGGRGGGGRSGGSRGGGSFFSSSRSSSSRSSSSSSSYRSSSSSLYSTSRSSSVRSSSYYSSSRPWYAPKTRKSKVYRPIRTRISSSSSDTSYGTVFKSETQRLMTRRISRKLFGLGVGVAFIGGAGFGFRAGLT